MTVKIDWNTNKNLCKKQEVQGSKNPQGRSLVTLNDCLGAFSVNAAMRSFLIARKFFSKRSNSPFFAQIYLPNEI